MRLPKCFQKIFRPRLSLDTAGGVAVELALATPILATLVLMGVDYGSLLNTAQSLAAATRVGAEFARNSTVCKSSATGVYVTPATNTTPGSMGIHGEDAAKCLPGIQSTTQNARPFSPSLTVTATLNCRCADNSVVVNCYDICPVAARPKSVYITVSAMQSPIFLPLVQWPGFPTTLASSTSIQIQ